MLLTPAQAAEKLGPSFTASRVRALLRSGELPRVRVGRRVFVANLDAWLAARVEQQPSVPVSGQTVDAAVAQLMPATRRFR
jgi:hypothetical protein